MYIKLTNGIVDKFPYSLEQLRRDYPNVSFPRGIDDISLVQYEVFPVTKTDPPTYNIEYDIQMGTPELIDGVWTQTWVQVPIPADRVATILDSILADKFEEIEDVRDSKLFQDVPYVFPGDTEVRHIKFRELRNQTEIQVALEVATLKQMMGNTDPCPFIVVEDEVKIQSPYEMIQMCLYVQARGMNIFLDASNHRNALLSEIAGLTGQAKLDAINAHDLSINWSV